MHPLRNHQSYFAAIGHRISGLLLALFLPFHFLLLGTALEGADNFDRYLALTDNPLVKVAEWGLVSLLALHLFFGLRVLLLEFTSWPSNRHQAKGDNPVIRQWSGWVVPGIVASAIVGAAFLVQVL